MDKIMIHDRLPVKFFFKKSLIETQGILDDSIDIEASIKRRLKTEEDIQKTLGISGKIVDGIVGTLGKLGVSSTFFENLKEAFKKFVRAAHTLLGLLVIKSLFSGRKTGNFIPSLVQILTLDPI